MTPKVAVNASEMEGRPTGVGRYLEGLLAGCLEIGDVRFHLFFKDRPFEHPLLEHPRVTAQFDGHGGWTPMWWEQLRLPRLLARTRFDAFFSPAYSLPPGLGDRPSLVTIHDLSFEHFPQEFGWRERFRRRFLARRAARSASRVLTDSTAIAADIAACYELPAEDLTVIPLAVDPHLGQPLAPMNRAKPSVSSDSVSSVRFCSPSALCFLGATSIV